MAAGRAGRAGAGRAGAVTALFSIQLVYFLSPANNILFMKPVDMNQFSNVYGKVGLLVNKADFLSQQTNQAMGNVGFGKHVLATTFVYPSLYLRLKKHFKPPTQLRQSDALLITICLLLSGDIHPCPGPLHSEPVNQNNITADVTCHTTISQGSAGSEVPARSVGAGVAGACSTGTGGRGRGLSALEESLRSGMTGGDPCLSADTEASVSFPLLVVCSLAEKASVPRGLAAAVRSSPAAVASEGSVCAAFVSEALHSVSGAGVARAPVLSANSEFCPTNTHDPSLEDF